MARNLGVRECYHCGHPVELVEEPHRITKRYAGPLYEEYQGMMVVQAQCPMCLARYMAWLDLSKRVKFSSTNPSFFRDGKPVDLSYWSTFNDEAAPQDLPRYDVQRVVYWVRVARINEENRDGS